MRPCLSAGQRIRVAMARGLVRRPAVLLMDEPLANLEVGIRGDLTELIVTAQERHGITSLYATSDFNEAVAVGDRVALLDDGTLQALGTPDQLACVNDKPREHALNGATLLPGGGSPRAIHETSLERRRQQAVHLLVQARTDAHSLQRLLLDARPSSGMTQDGRSAGMHTPARRSMANGTMAMWHRTAGWWQWASASSRAPTASSPFERIAGEERSDGRRTRVWSDGVADPLIAPGRTVTILRDMGQESAVAAPVLDEAIDLAARRTQRVETAGCSPD